MTRSVQKDAPFIRNSHVWFLILAVQVGMAIAGCGNAPEALVGDGGDDPSEDGGHYGSVTEDSLRSTEFSHRTGGEHFDFTWSFEDDRFVIEGNEIPPDLITAVLGPDASATRIEGKWRIHNGTIDLVLEADSDNRTARTISLPIYDTGVIRIETLEAQYVF